MNKVFKSSLILFALTLCGCVNSDYDLGKIEFSEVNLPLGDTKKVYLPTILESTAMSGYMELDNDGNYYIPFTDGNFACTVPAIGTKALTLDLYNGSLDFSEIIRSLKNDNLTLDMHSLRLDLGITTNLPFGLTVPASLSVGDKKLDLDEMTVPAESAATYSFTESSIEGFDNFFDPMPESVGISMSAVIDNDLTSLESKDYNVNVDYSFVKYAFGTGFKLIGEIVIDNINISIPDETELTEAKLDLNVNNTIPMDMDFQLQFLNARGDVMDIKTTTTGKVKGNCQENRLSVTLTARESFDFKSIKAILTTTSSDQQVVLNQGQYVQLTDISLTLPEGFNLTVGK